jgi:hypothetical protein
VRTGASGASVTGERSGGRLAVRLGGRPRDRGAERWPPGGAAGGRPRDPGRAAGVAGMARRGGGDKNEAPPSMSWRGPIRLRRTGTPVTRLPGALPPTAWHRKQQLKSRLPGLPVARVSPASQEFPPGRTSTLAVTNLYSGRGNWRKGFRPAISRFFPLSEKSTSKHVLSPGKGGCPPRYPQRGPQAGAQAGSTPGLRGWGTGRGDPACAGGGVPRSGPGPGGGAYRR